MNKSDLLSAMRAGHARLERLIDGLSEEQMITPRLHDGWSGKDLLAHLGYWEQRMAAVSQMLMNGETPPDTVGEYDVDQINAAAFDTYHSHGLGVVRAFERKSFQALLAQAEAIPEADLLDPQRFSWLKGGTLGGWIEGNAYGHYEEHEAELDILKA